MARFVVSPISPSLPIICMAAFIRSGRLSRAITSFFLIFDFFLLSTTDLLVGP